MPTSKKVRPFRAIDLYSGSGAVSAGLKLEGFSVLAAVDNDEMACATYKLNHPEVELVIDNIRVVNVEKLYEKLNILGNIDLLVVCAPCQPFSNQNRKRASSDDRADLIIEALKFVRIFNPKLVFFENVPGLASNGPIEELRAGLLAEGFHLSKPIKLNAADMGVPQRRERCILIATKDKNITNNFGSDIKPLKRISVFDAIGALPSLKSGETSLNDPLHRARAHQPITLKRLAHIPKDGGSRNSLPKDLQLKCHFEKDNDFPDVYGRLKWENVAPTLTTGCTDLTRGRFAHPRDDRALTLREAALLQSFPINYKFHGNSGQIARQIGNAVPVNMIRTLAPYLKSAIINIDENFSKNIKN